MSSSAVSTVRKLLGRFRSNRRGSVAIEFSLIALPFFALLFAIIETAMVFFAGQVLETAVQDTSRVILTGQAQTGATPLTKQTFKDAVCARLTVMFDCQNGISVDVQSYSSFTSVKIVDPIDAGKNFLPAMQYSPGGAGDIVVVRLFYQWPLFVTGLGYNISNLTGSKRLLSATAAFRNEPYN
jgi:Flp pilus assembly protein TadG